MRTMLAIATLFVSLSSTNLSAATANLIAFGDSLVDGGNLDALVKAQGGSGINDLTPPDTFPPRVYPEGQFTNGKAWTTQIGLVPSIAGGTNFAFGGARAVTNDDFIPDLKQQLKLFKASGISVDSNTTAAIWMGGNDLRAFDPGWSNKRVKREVGKITRNIASSVRRLYKLGVGNVIVLGLPELPVLPAAVSQFNERLIKVTSRLNHRLPDSDIRYYDINGLFQQVLSQVPPQLAGVPCVFDPVGCGNDPNNYILFDEIHPSEWVHTILAREIEREVDPQLAPVPLPATAPLLLAGLGGMALWVRRRKSQV